MLIDIDPEITMDRELYSDDGQQEPEDNDAIVWETNE